MRIAFAVLLAFALQAIAADANAAGPSFVDPTVSVRNAENVHLGELDYVAPFAQLLAGSDAEQEIEIGDESNVQDSVLVNATTRDPGSIRLGEQVILAHGAAVVGPAAIGAEGSCPDGSDVCPSFIGFNAVVDGAIVEKDAMVIHLARVAPGVRIPSGLKVLPGKFVRNQDEVAAKTAPVSEADRAFMHGVIEVNVEFAVGYSELEAEEPSNVRGINFNPHTHFNDRDLPRFDGVPTRDAAFRNRIIGDVRIADEKDEFAEAMRSRISLRADEGDPFVLGEETERIAGRHTLHALEFAQIALGEKGSFGFHSLVHGGPADFNPTRTGENFVLGQLAVFFRSRAGDDVTVGNRSLVQQASLPSGTRVPPCTIRIGAATSSVEWCGVPFPGPQ